MKSAQSIARACLLVGSAILLVSCGSAVPQSSPVAIQNETLGVSAQPKCSAPWLPTTRALRCHPNTGKSWMAAGAKSQALLYVSDIGAEEVDVFSYPGGAQVGTLTGFNEPNGLCSDAKGNVFVTDTYNGRIVEFAHGATTPTAILADSGSTPIGCAVDPTTGDLAVTNYNFLATGVVAVYPNAQGTPKLYSGLWITYYCTYDDKGNLFIDGFNNVGYVELEELAQGSSKLVGIGIGVRAGWAGGVMWSGNHIALGDPLAGKYVPSQSGNVVYQLTIANGRANVDATMPLSGAGDVVQFWIKGKRLIAADAQNENVAFFEYPTGGNPRKTMQDFYEPAGVTVSR